ncbi:MAG TPA: hypothetical protein VM368_08270, partial [Flavisolibacter sp.]|nr:hypothetical protein [Flavisolibacter sp.]
MRAIFLFFFSLLFCSTVFSQSVGTKVSFVAADNKTYTGVVKETYGNYYKVRYDGYEFDAWLTADQFKVVSTSTNTTDYNSQSTTTNARSGLTAIFEFGKGNGWASQIIEQTFNNYVSALSATDQARLLNFIKKANTPSARFFVLKSFLAGDDFKLLQKFINELNQYPEYIQQEKCLVTMRKSIIQQWQQTCSVTTVQACLGDLSPRYTWEVKQIDNYDVIAP